MIATNLIEQFNKMRKSRYQLGHRIHFLQQITRVEFSAQTDGGTHAWTRDGASNLSLVFGEVRVGTTLYFTWHLQGDH
eukprot:2722298-Pyramimonas_sp.AAC.1